MVRLKIVKVAFMGVLAIGLLNSCSIFKKKPITKYDLKNFKKSDIYPAAKAVAKQDVMKIQEYFTLHPGQIDDYERRFNQTLLHWAVMKDLPMSAKALMELGADPNVEARDGTVALIHASNLSDSYLLKQLLKLDVDVNYIATIEPFDSYQPLKTSLIAAAGKNLNNVKLLLDAGADIDYTEKRFGVQNALISAFVAERIDIVKFLIMEQKIDLDNIIKVNRDGDTTDVRHHLRKLAFPLDSEDYLIKMEIVDYLKARKINYWDVPVPRNMYHNYSPKYLKMY